MKSEIRAFLRSMFPSRDFPGLRDDDSLLEVGLIDSMVMLDLVAHLESSYGIRVEEDEMLPENFDSIEAISRYVGRKRQQP